MLCPSCNSSSLKPVKLQPTLAARQCLKCFGLLVDLLHYRKWAENFNNDQNTCGSKLKEVNDNSKALLCPKCSKLMLKFRMAGSTKNKVDLCTNCDEAWLDDGEWELLGSLAIQHKLHAIFTEPWQKNIRDDQINKNQEQRFKEMLGNEEYTKLSNLRNWIKSHPKKSDLLRYLTRP